MKVFVIGDYRTGTGPANVTREYLLRLPKGTKRLMANSKPVRALEIIAKMPFCDVALFSGYSKQNILGLKWAKVLNKPTAYLMHGAVDHENAINECVSKEMTAVEKKTMELSDCILAVSKRFAKWLKTYYPEYGDKIDYCTNGVDIKALKGSNELKEVIKRDPCMIFTIGGGMPRKKIKHICQAVELLNAKANYNKYRLVVAGAGGKDDDAINSYPFVENVGLVDSDTTSRLYREASLFVQNSCFETFGLSPMEALMNGSSVLLSKEVGALDILRNVEDTDVIRNWYDEVEIASKIEILLKKGNAIRLLSAFDKESSSWETRTLQLQDRLHALIALKKEKR